MFKIALMFFSIFSFGNHALAKIDSSMLDLCIEYSEGKVKLAELKSHDLYRKMHAGMKEKFSFDPDLVKSKKIELRLFQKMYLNNLISSVGDLKESSMKFISKNASKTTSPKINIVCGGPWDAYVLVFDAPEVFIDVTMVNYEKLESIVAHELWHVSYKGAYPKRWKSEYLNGSVINQLSYQIINEGVGHYYSFQKRVEPKIDYNDWRTRTSRLFKLFSSKYDELLEIKKEKLAKEHVWRSHAGVPFWEKWSAVTGAIVAYRLNKELGARKVSELINEGHCRYLNSYQTMAKTKGYETFPQKFISKVCNL